jgi:hypothetical protein
MTTFVSIDQDVFAGAGYGYLYNADDIEVTVRPGITVHSDGTYYDAIATNKADSKLINNGRIVSDAWGGVGLYGPDAVVTNNEGGLIEGLLYGVWVNGFPNPASAMVINYGEISGKESVGVYFSLGSGGNELLNYGLITSDMVGVGSGSAYGPSVFNNFGVIRSAQYGVTVNSGSTAIVNNEGGRILGEEAAVFIEMDGQLRLKNKGKIVGDLDLNGADGADKVVNKGKIKGDIELGSGDDSFTFAGGKQGEVLGEAGADLFTFKRKLAPEKHVATIGDFTPGEDAIVLSKGLFKGLGEKGALKGKLFHAGNKAADVDDRIVYDENSGKLWHDPDGRGGAEAELIARLDEDLALKAGDFLVAA